MDEFGLIRRYFARAGGDGFVRVGIGDDAAVMMMPEPGNALGAATDTLVKGVHFPVTLDAWHVGWRAVMVNVSDFAAMGARPRWMTLVASFTKSYKEAQTWLSVVLVAPTLPILIVSILTLRPQLEFMFIPSLSQHLILVDMIKNEPINALHVAISAGSTLAIGAVLTWICARLYRREGLLG